MSQLSEMESVSAEDEEPIPDNIVIEYGNDPFKFMGKSSYAISHNSTVLLETIHFGLITFDFDVDEDIKNYTTRSFSELCIKSSDDIIAFAAISPY